MTPLLMMSLLGLALIIPAFLNDDTSEEEAQQPEPEQDPLAPEPEDETVASEPEAGPIVAGPEGEPVGPETPVEPEEVLLPATATLEEATNTVTVTTAPEETGTLYTVANRVDAFNGESNFLYETSVFLVPEGVDLEAAINAAIEESESTFYYDILSDIGARELGYWFFDPAAAEGETGAIQDFEYPEGIDREFLQIYSINFGDGGQITHVRDIDGEEGLADGIEELVTNTTIASIENNGGDFVTMPTDFDGTLTVLETTTNYFFEGQLIRTDVSVGYLTVDQGTDFGTAVLSLTEEVTQTPTDEGFDTVTDGTLTEEEFFFGVPGTSFLGSTGISIIEYDTDGNILFEQTNGGLGVTANVDIMRYEVQVAAVATPAASGGTLSWNTSSFAGVVTRFDDIVNLPSEAGVVVSSSTSF